jgi:hypothetical protein
MARNTVTESDLGLEPTEEEMAAPSSMADDNDDDISLHDDDPTPQAAAEAKPEAEAKPAELAKPEEPKTVDVRALQEARAEAREAKQRATILEQRWNDFLAGSQQQAKPAESVPEIPKFGNDPIRAGEWTQEQIIALLDKQKADAEQTATRTREEQEFQTVARTVMQDYEVTKQTDPSIDEAYNALRKSQGEEMLAMGYTIPEAQAELARMEREHIKFVAARGLPIGNYIKALASARGWQAGAAPAQAQPAKTDLKAIADAQQRHQSLSDAPGGEAIPPLDAKALARMSDKEFKAWMSKKGNEAKFDEIMGR